MRAHPTVIVLGFVLTSLAVVSIYGQQKPDNDTSLGDIARQIKAQKAKEPKPAKVFTNDNISAPADNASGVDVSSKEKGPANSTPEESGEHTKTHDAEYFRSQMSKLQDRLATDKRELDVLQQKLGQNQMQYYNDPNQSLLQQYSRDDVDKLTADIDAKKQKVADDEKAIEDLHEQLRREGGDPGWLRQ